MKKFKTVEEMENELGKLYLIEKIKKEIGEFDHENGDENKYMEMVLDFLYDLTVEELTTKK